jgi:hypothetical protein
LRSRLLPLTPVRKEVYMDVITIGKLLLVICSIGYVMLQIVLLLMDRHRSRKQ